MDSDITAAVVVTIVATTTIYIWLVVIDVVRQRAERRRWRNARKSARSHYGFQKVDNVDQASTHFNYTQEREHTS